MAFLSLTYVVLVMSVGTGMGQIVSVNFTPEVTPYSLPGKLTTNTVTLIQPSCFFDNLTSLPCSSSQCEIWLVAAIDTGVSNFDSDKTKPQIDSLSPYPTAFSSNTSKNYFLTQVGLQRDFPCLPSARMAYFRVGAGGRCSTDNCNGELPVGSTANFKYLLLNPSNKTVLAESVWNSNITLYSMKNPDAIDDSLPGRSAAMIVITVILCVTLASLLVALAMLIYMYTCCFQQENQATKSPVSLRNAGPRDNSGYEVDPPASGQSPANPIQLRSYTEFDVPMPKPSTEL